MYKPKEIFGIFVAKCFAARIVHLSFLFLLSWSLNFSNVQSQNGQSSAVGIRFCHDATNKGFRFNGTVRRQLHALSGIDCILLCIKNDPCCRSVNYRKKPKYDGKENCELLSTVASEQPKDLKTDENYNYYILLQPKRTFDCHCSSCKNNGTCVEKSKNCSCLSGFFGNQCEHALLSCADWFKKGARQDGVYKINPDGKGAFDVRCDFTNTVGWTVFQRRIDGRVDFYRNWADYKNGFGNLDGEFWLGLDKINRLSMIGQSVLRVDLQDFENERSFAEYNTFSVSSESDMYKLTAEGYSGDAGDSLFLHNHNNFTTKDVDQDLSSTDNCAQTYHGAWWYNSCLLSNLNGQYHRAAPIVQGRGIVWSTWKGFLYSLKETEMKMWHNFTIIG